MRKLGQLFVEFLKAEDGPTALEYAMMLAAIILVCLLYFTIMVNLGTRDNKPQGRPAGAYTGAS